MNSCAVLHERLSSMDLASQVSYGLEVSPEKTRKW
jgi:hypothetical protein